MKEDFEKAVKFRYSPPHVKVPMLRAVLLVAILGSPVWVPANSAAQHPSDQTAPDIALHPHAASRQELEDFNASQSVIGANSAEISANDFAAKDLSRKLCIFLYTLFMY